MNEQEKHIQQVLVQAMSKTLESLAFVEAIPLNDDTPPLPDDMVPQPRKEVIWAGTPLVRPVEGKVLLLMPPELGRMLTDFMFGMMEDYEISDEQILDAIAETCNVLAGRVMNGWIGENAEFELGLPERGACNNDDEVPMPSGHLHKLDYAVEGHTLTVVLGGKDFQ